MIRAVLFDLDGTLFDRSTAVRRCIEAQHERFAGLLSVPRSVYVSKFLELDARGHTKKDIVYGRIATEYSLTQDDAVSLCDDFYAHYHRHAVAFPGAVEVLRDLRASDFKLGLITNGRGAHQRATINALGIGQYFDSILISEVEGIRKPDARIFQLALDQCGVSPLEAVYIGDHPEADVLGARNAGLRGVWKRDEYWGECSEADAVIDDVREIPELLVTWSRLP